MKKILLITTGGPLACTSTPNGLEPTLEGADILEAVPELAELCQAQVEDAFTIDSTNMLPRHWQQLAAIINDAYNDFDGFVITHGTDTLAYTAAALSKMLQNLGKPVILTGSQLPLGYANSDARTNVQLAFSMAVGNLPGVFVAFGNKVIKGHLAKKIFSKNFNAFESVNEPPVLFFTKEGLKKNLALAQPTGNFNVNNQLDTRVLVLTIKPGSSATMLEHAVTDGYKGVVLECFGAGGVPLGEATWLPALKKAHAAGVRIVCVSQCLFDGVDLDIYPMGKAAAKLGVESGGTKTVEAALVDLMWELGQGNKVNK